MHLEACPAVGQRQRGLTRAAEGRQRQQALAKRRTPGIEVDGIVATATQPLRVLLERHRDFPCP